MPTPQMTIFLDKAGVIRCEAPGKNGSRQKVDLPFDFAVRNPELMTALGLQADEIRQRELAALRDVQNQNIDYLVKNFGVGFAGKVYKNGDLAQSKIYARRLRRAQATEELFNLALTRLRHETEQTEARYLAGVLNIAEYEEVLKDLAGFTADLPEILETANKKIAQDRKNKSLRLGETRGETRKAKSLPGKSLEIPI